jgi:hypothetical protein
MKFSYHRLFVLAVAAASLAVPASAWAHGSVYTDTTARIVEDPQNPSPPVTVVNQTRHVVTNHGFTFVLRESNGATDKGMVDFSMLPGPYRSQPGFEPGAAGTRTRLLSEGDTAAQPHATCRGVAALAAEDAVLAWQGEDPFYNYVPFQATSAGLEDDPATWLPVVQARTGVDLTQSDPATACAGLGGTYTPADETATPVATLNSGYAHLLTEPLNAEILSLSADLVTAQGAASTAAAQVAAKSATDKENASLKAEVARLKASALSIEPVGKLTLGQLAGRPQVSVTGPAGKSVTVRILARKAKALRLKSSVLAKVTAQIRVDGTALVRLAPSGKAKAALKKAKSAGVTFEVTSGDRTASTARTLSR